MGWAPVFLSIAMGYQKRGKMSTLTSNWKQGFQIKISFDRKPEKLAVICSNV